MAASAGTGKTKVLTDRVLNLLLAGTEPGRILCLTFTKAAAAEMANRLNRRLAEWAILPDMKLRDEIAGITGVLPDAGQYARARQLFARVLDTPGGMRILTLHAFCQSVLRRFPLEAGIPPQFEVMDERSTAELRQEAQNQILEQARAAPEGALARALAEVLSHIREQGFAALMAALTTERGRLAQLFEAGGRARTLSRGGWTNASASRPARIGPGCSPASRPRPASMASACAIAVALHVASKAVTDRNRGRGDGRLARRTAGDPGRSAGRKPIATSS